MWRVIQRQQVSSVRIVARNAIGMTTYEDMERKCTRRVVILQAQIAGKPFTEYPKIRKNIEHRHKEERYSCTVCNNRFNRRDKLKTHVANHSEATELVCEDCGEKCNRDDKLRGHGKKMHKEGGNFTCPHCQKTFTEYPKIRKHIKHRHEAERYSCTVCYNRFTWRDQLKNHSKATDLICEDCGEKCNRDDNLRGYGKKMHKEGGNFTYPDCQVH